MKTSTNPIIRLTKGIHSLPLLAWLLTLAGTALPAAAQNITDLSVMTGDEEEVVVADHPSAGSLIADSVFLHPDRIRYDSRCFQIEGKDCFIYSGTFHYFRVPQPLWEDRFRKLKEAGFNCVETYIPWNWHERQMPASADDESCLDMQPLDDFLRMAEEFGLYVIVRPGPYICAEWSGGGFPQWLLRKKPAKTASEVWLQSTDPEFLRWNEHWYRAVCRTVAPHQLTRKEKGQAGVILFQIENEFNRIKWFSSDVKRDYLARLAQMVRRLDIDVPIITCWTSEARNVESGPLNGVLDMVNSYPRWQVEKNFGRLINQQLRTQPGKPLMSGELQGGWMSEVGGKLSWEQDGLTPAQTQNITLYALQRGFCALNYYMAVGGTNFDDWGARGMTTTYDYAAAIGEDGSLNERYRRFRGLAAFVREHGTRIARSTLADIRYTSTDPSVRLALRVASNGDRYYFVRTEDHTRSHWGTLQTDSLALDFALEPFGAQVYYLPAYADRGTWYPRLPEPGIHSAQAACTLRLQAVRHFSDPLPTRWKRLKRGEYLDGEGIYGRHFTYYRTYAPQGRLLEVGCIGRGVINGTDGDDVLVSVDGRLLSPLQGDAQKRGFRLPGDSTSRRRKEVLILFESKGLHHHTNQQVEAHWQTGIDYAKCDGEELPLAYAYTEQQRGTDWSKNTPLPDADHPNPLLSWHTASFTLPSEGSGYHLKLAHTGNGFIYLNGHCIGRCWEKGPQTDYYLPECWLRTGGENRIAISLRPTEKGADIAHLFIYYKGTESIKQ